MPAFIDWNSLFKWTQPAPPPPPPRHEPPSPAADDHLASSTTPDSYLLLVTVAAAVLGAVGIWLLVRKLHHPRGPPVGPARIDAQVAARLQNHDDAIAALRRELRQTAQATEEHTKEALDSHTTELEAQTARALGQQAEDADERTRKAVSARIDAIEATFQETLERRIQAVEAQTQAALEAHTAAVEATLRRRLSQRINEIEDAVRTKLNKEAFDALYAALSGRVETLEGGVRLLDSRQLDQEACGVAQRTLGRRLDALEPAARALGEGLRAAAGRGRVVAQRLEAAEDAVGAVSGRAVMLAHDVDRLTRQVRALPGPDHLRSLADDWEARFAGLETRVVNATAEAAAPPAPPALSWSPLVAQAIEPAGPVDAAAAAATSTTPHDRRDPVYNRFGYAVGMTPPTPSPSDRSHSSQSSRMSSFAGSEALSGTPTPGAAKRKKLQDAGFKEPTFASRQRLYQARTVSSAS